MDIRLYPHQGRVVESKCKRLGLFGGVGSGKSYGMVVRLMAHALKWKTQVMILRRTMKEVQKVVLTDLLEKWGEVIESSGMDKVVLKNGSVIHLVHGWDDERGVRHLDGYSISAFLLSQAEMMPVETYQKLRDRNRNMGAGGETLELFEGNPAGRDWIWEMFCKGVRVESRSAEVDGGVVTWDEYVGDGSLFISVPTQNFPWLPEGYLAGLMKSHSQRYIDRYVLGKWDQYSGLVYPCFSERVHVIEPWPVEGDLVDERWMRCVGADWGLRNPTAVLWALYDSKEDVFYVYREYYGGGKTASETGKVLKGMQGKEKVGMGVIDPSTGNRDPVTGTCIKDELMKEWGVLLADANNSKEYGIERVNRYFEEGRILIFNCCTNLIRELSNYQYDSNDVENRVMKTNPKEQPEKKDDHACLAGDSLVNTVNGDIPIRDLVGKSGWVYSYDGARKRISVSVFENVMKTGTKKTIKITLDDGTEIRMTEDHPVLLRGGDYIEAGQLSVGDSIMPCYQSIDSHGHLTVRLNNGEKMFAHRLVFGDTKGPLPADSWEWNIHHVDGDKLNNDPNNLELMTRADHGGLHAKSRHPDNETRNRIRESMKRVYLIGMFKKKNEEHLKEIREQTKEWHNSEEGRKWHSEHGKNCWTEEKRRARTKERKCLECGRTFKSVDIKGKYCGNNCKAMYNRRKRVERFGMTDAQRRKERLNGTYNHKVLRIEDGIVEDVFNMTTGHHNFSVGGIIVHNCDALRYMVASKDFFGKGRNKVVRKSL